MTYNGVRFFFYFSALCPKIDIFFWVQDIFCIFSSDISLQDIFSLEISLQHIFFLKSPLPRLKIQMFGHLEIIEREWK